MNKAWKLQDAKAKFSQVVENALKIGPQFVTRHGQDAVVIVSTEEYVRITSEKPTLKEFLLSIPKLDEDVDFERQKDGPRSVEL
ncbi:MAG: type II toxin-antitoxin system Phd/YefM family antitoxin [Caldilineaceae bacterium]|nr:type II toxin-antitoxin system Phd/YefM family antitoxin [Caldilineaceae bacterium]